MTRTLACRGASGRGSVQRRLCGKTAGAPADGHAAPRGQGRRLGARARRRRVLQAAQLDEPTLQRHARRSTTSGWAPGPSSTRPTRRWSSRSKRSCTTAGTISAWTPACPRTGSRHTCRSCWPPRWRRSAPDGAWSAASSPPRSDRSTCCAGTPTARASPSRSSGAGDIDGVEQLTRYLELLNRDPRLAPVRGIFAAQEIKPQARVLAHDRGIACMTVDYDALRGFDDPTTRLF